MRIIAGKFRNRNLKAADNFRPTSDRVRETLFNILQNEIPDSTFVDAFAGSGAVGIEALSRGARRVIFLESNQRSLIVLEANLLHCATDDSSWRIYSMPVVKGLVVASRNEEPPPDVIFFDPPYDYEGYSDLLERTSTLFPGALIVLESSTRSNYEVPPKLECYKDRQVGETRLAFFKASPLLSQN